MILEVKRIKGIGKDDFKVYKPKLTYLFDTCMDSIKTLNCKDKDYLNKGYLYDITIIFSTKSYSYSIKYCNSDIKVPKEYLVNVVKKVFNTASNLDIDISKLTLIIFKKDNLDSEIHRITVTKDSSSNISYIIDEI